jgi:hypothetical protein
MGLEVDECIIILNDFKSLRYFHFNKLEGDKLNLALRNKIVRVRRFLMI